MLTIVLLLLLGQPVVPANYFGELIFLLLFIQSTMKNETRGFAAECSVGRWVIVRGTMAALDFIIMALEVS